VKTSLPTPGIAKTETPALRESIRALYDDLAREIARAGPVCDLSGRCCRFADYDHTLFLSGIEAEILVADAPPACRPLDAGATCPWQDDRGHCTAREARPLGCRVYYCDPTYQEIGQGLSETYLSRLKELANAHGRPWAYAPLHRHLRDAIDRGEWRDPALSAAAEGCVDVGCHSHPEVLAPGLTP
jgi:Fe-S-cluster containining protein